jgi:pilus assembly protein Flp/PilA
MSGERHVNSLDYYWIRLVDVWLPRVLRKEEGQDMVEYALLMGLITLGTIAVIILVGPALKDLFQNIVNNLGNA